MKKICLFILSILICSTNPLLAYTQSQYVDDATWNKLAPFFLPETHPIKAKLDALFSTRISLTPKTLEDAGFETPTPREFTHTIVTKHPELPGYIVKLFSDDYPKSEVKDLHDRIIGAIIAKETIDRCGHQSLFKVPKKWIYPLSDKSVVPPGYYRKNFILIAEDMKTLSKKENIKKWRSPDVTTEMLTALYTVVQEAGLDDSVLISNIKFNSRNKICFVDTGVYHRWPIRFHLLLKSLSPAMQIQWIKLIEKRKK